MSMCAEKCFLVRLFITMQSRENGLEININIIIIIFYCILLVRKICMDIVATFNLGMTNTCIQ